MAQAPVLASSVFWDLVGSLRVSQDPRFGDREHREDSDDEAGPAGAHDAPDSSAAWLNCELARFEQKLAARPGYSSAGAALPDGGAAVRDGLAWSDEAPQLLHLLHKSQRRAVGGEQLRSREFALAFFRTLRLDERGISEIDAGFRDLESLSTLTMCNNRLSTLDNLPPGLQQLDVYGNSLTSLSGADARPTARRQQQLPSLLHLGAGCNALPHADGVARRFPGLLSLDLSFNELCDLGALLRELAALPRLRQLWVMGNPLCLLPAFRDQLRDAAPSLQFVDDLPLQAEATSGADSGSPSEHRRHAQWFELEVRFVSLDSLPPPPPSVSAEGGDAGAEAGGGAKAGKAAGAPSASPVAAATSGAKKAAPGPGGSAVRAKSAKGASALEAAEFGGAAIAPSAGGADAQQPSVRGAAAVDVEREVHYTVRLRSPWVAARLGDGEGAPTSGVAWTSLPARWDAAGVALGATLSLRGPPSARALQELQGSVDASIIMHTPAALRGGVAGGGGGSGDASGEAGAQEAEEEVARVTVSLRPAVDPRDNGLYRADISLPVQLCGSALAAHARRVQETEDAIAAFAAAASAAAAAESGGGGAAGKGAAKPKGPSAPKKGGDVPGAAPPVMPPPPTVRVQLALNPSHSAGAS